jgi:hypothetical protein
MKWKLGLIGAGILGVAVVLMVLLVKPATPSAPPPLPNPNGYTILVQAAKLVPAEIPDPAQASPDVLQEFSTNVTATIQEVRRGLSYQCRVPIEYSESFLGQHLQDLAAMKKLAQSFRVAAVAAAQERRYPEAMRLSLDTIRIGQKGSQGGFIIDALVGIAVEAIGLGPLESLVNKLDAGQCREALQALQTIEAEAESVEEFLQTERQLGRALAGWRYPIMRIAMYKSQKQTEVKFRNKVGTIDLRRRRLQIDLAARAFELEKGARPASLKDLVPAYLKSVPIDPETKTNMVYSF